MYDPEVRAQFLKQYEACVAKITSPEGRARLIARGLDPETELKKITALKDAAVAADEVCEKTDEQMLQAGADVADAQYDLFKALRQALQEHKQANPFDPRLEEWEDILEAMAEQMPKEEQE
jgi:hypothetical protein